MKILAVGDYKDNAAEGMEVITKRIVDVMREERVNVSTVQAKYCLLYFFSILFHRFDRIIFTHGPGKGVYFLTMFISLLGGPKVIWLATRENIKGFKLLDRLLFRLDRIYCGQNNKRLIDLSKKISAEFSKVIIGIDLSRINIDNTVSNETRRMIVGRQNTEIPIVIHVGHIRANRGLNKLVNIKQALGESIDVVVIGSPSLSKDASVVNSLKNAKVVILNEYIENLGSIYSAADLYLFPVDPINGGAVDLPLSVIESIACGTPVVSTDFGVLKEYLSNNKLIQFSDVDFEDTVIDRIKSGLLNKSTNISELPKEFDLDYLAKKIIRNF